MTTGLVESVLAEIEREKVELTEDGFRVYTDDVPIRLGDVIRFKHTTPAHSPFEAMIVTGFEKKEIRPGVHYRYWHVSRVHCRVSNFLGYVPDDAQPSAQFERLEFEEEELRAKCVAYTTGPSGRIDNRAWGAGPRIVE